MTVHTIPSYLRHSCSSVVRPHSHPGGHRRTAGCLDELLPNKSAHARERGHRATNWKETPLEHTQITFALTHPMLPAVKTFN